MMTKVELKRSSKERRTYFATGGQPARFGRLPYIVQEGKPTIQEFTGLISIAGKRRGIVYFTGLTPHARPSC